MSQETATLDRKTFIIDRTLEFFSEKELQMQIGHSRNWWPVAMVKELIDNGSDACETAGILPEIEVTVEPDAVSVKDNGPGLPAKVIEQSLDYMIRVSDKSHYVSPTRGQLGNALKCLWAVPFVMNGHSGRIDVVTSGRRHRIEVGVDRVAQKPKICHTIENDGFVKNGTFVKMHVPGIASLLEYGESAEFYNTPIWATDLIQNYAAFNPHAKFTYAGLDFNLDYDRSVTDLFKWLPSNPTSPHWYNIERLRGLIAAYVNLEQNGGKVQTVRGFVSEFHGLKSTMKQKRVTNAAELSRAYLHDLVEKDDISVAAVERLLSAMIENSKPVKSKALGLIGEDHIRAWMTNSYVATDSVKYKKVFGETDGMPFVLEVATGAFADGYEDYGREVTAGLNWSPTLQIPFTELSERLGEARVNSYDPFRVLIHLACPRLDFSDRGKGQLSLTPAVESALEKAIKAVTKHITVAKRKADREDRLRDKQLEEMRKHQKSRQMTVRAAAFSVMEEAYMQASADNTLPANARQIMYAARPEIIKLTGKAKPWSNSSYFTQTLLPDFQKEYPALTADWDVVYDARGKLIEPHTNERVDLGTVAVRRYVKSWTNGCDISTKMSGSLLLGIDTRGPVNRYRYALFVEKEGFDELWKSVELASRFDLAIMSTKGMSVTAARHLVDELSKKDVTILVLRDFDKAGFSIVHTLRSDTRRWKYETAPNIIDLGLRLSDVDQMDLDSEDVTYDSKVDPRVNLIDSGASEDEADFLVSGGRPGAWHGKRIELNAMTSPLLVKWLESKLKQHGVAKVVPDEDTLAQAYKRACYVAYINKAIKKAANAYNETASVPNDLSDLVREYTEGSSLSWDDAIGDIAGE